MDLLQDRLLRAHAGGAVFAQTRAHPPWGLRLQPGTQLAVHAMISGEGWMWLDDPTEAIRLRAGELLLVRGTLLHHLADEPGQSCVDLAQFRSSDRGQEGNSAPGEAPTSRQAATGHQPAADPDTVFLCGAYRFAGDIGQALIDTLPPVLHIRPEPHGQLRAIVGLLSDELASSQPGQSTVLDRLLDVLLVHLIRSHFNDQQTTPPPWYAANAHLRLGPALQAIHDNPGYSWTITDLARLANVSRATFARTFADVLHQTPMEYLTDWRMTLARSDLLTSNLTLAAIAGRYGYASPYAFSAAFQRHHGLPPGRWRRGQNQALVDGEVTG